MRLSFTMIGAAAVAVVGVAGLVRGVVPLTSSDSGSNSASSSDSGSTSDGMSMGGMSMGGSAASSSSSAAPTGATAGVGGPIVVTGAYVQEPASPDVVAVYFTLSNITNTDDRLVAVTSGLGEQVSIHTSDSMAVAPNGLAVPAHKTASLSVGRGHIMIEKVLGAVLPGQTVNLVLQFEHAPKLTLAAPVIAIGAAVPKIGG